MKLSAILSAAAASLVALAACSESDPAEDDLAVGEEGLTDADVAAEEEALAADASASAEAEAEEMEAGETDAEAVPGGETVGGDGSEINLTPLGYAQIEPANLQGELGCSFSRETDTNPILVARADVVPEGLVTGVVAVNAYPERIAQANAGGFDDLADGIELSSRAMTLQLDVLGEDRSDSEQSVRPATLTVMRMDGAERIYEGMWTCGP